MGRLGMVLAGLGAVLGRSWGGLGDVGAVWDENADFSMVSERFGGPATPAPPPRSKRAGPVEWVTGRHKSLPKELAWCSVQVLYTP